MALYQVLGPLRVERHGREVDLGGRKQRAVLAALLLDVGRVVSTDRLVDLVWGASAAGGATATLQSYISHLRRALRDEDGATSPILRRTPGYVLEVDPADVDATVLAELGDRARRAVQDRDWTGAVDAAEGALALCRGPVLADLADEEWVRVAAGPLDERRGACERDLVTGLLGCGRPAVALAVTRRLAVDRPLDERVQWLHAVALHRDGRTADALAALQSFRDLLGEELGLDPGPAIRDLQGGLLRQDPTLDSWPASPDDPGRSPTPGVVEPASGALPAPDTRLRRVGIVGRAHELAELTAAWTAARSGASPWVVLSGPPGIGKSALAAEAARAWAADGSVASTSCPEDAGAPSWWPLRQVVRQLGGDPDEVLRSVGATDANAARFAVYEKVAALLRAAEGPVLVHVEDVQWADAATLGLLTHLASTLHVPGRAFLLTLRDEVATTVAAPLLAAVGRRGDGRRLALPPLSDSDVAELVARVSGETVQGTELHELAGRTGGNPLFVSEYARLPADLRSEQIPDAIRVVLERRLTALPASVAEVLSVAAVCGEVLDLDVLRAVTGLETYQLAELLDVAADEHVVVTDRTSEGYAFGHALLRDALVASLRPSRRFTTHRRVAEALAGRTDPAGLAARATHLLAAGAFADAGEVVDACRAVAVDAQDRWDADEAAGWWQQALTTYDARVRDRSALRDALVTGLVESWVRAGRGQQMLDFVESSLEGAWLGQRRAELGHFAAMLSRLTGAWPWIAYGSDPGPLLERLGTLAPQLEDDLATRSRVLSALAIGNCYSPDPKVPDELSAEAIDLAEVTADEAVLADALLGRAMTYAGVAVRSREVLDLLRRLAELHQPQRELDRVISHGIASMATIVLGDMRATRHHVRTGIALAERMRLPVSLAQLRWAEGTLRLWTADDVSRLGEEHDAAFAVHSRTDLAQSVTLILANLTLRWEQGRLHEGLEVDNPFLAGWIDAVVAAARHAPDAGRLVSEQVQRAEPLSWTSHGRLVLLAHAAADLELTELVPALVDGLTPLAHYLAGFGHCGITGPVALPLARLEALRGDLAAARRHLDTAMTLCVAAGGDNAVLRCRLLSLRLDALEGRPPLPDLVRDVEVEASRRGLLGVAAEARQLVSS